MSVHRYSTGAAAAPAVVTMTPYRKEGQLRGGWNLAERGYHYFIADVRGFGGSRGPYGGVLSAREIQDYAELIEWLARQPFCSGKVGTVGGSYTGANQMLAAARHPQGLACIAPTVGPVDFYRDWNWRGGILTFGIWGSNFFRSGQDATFREGLRFYYQDLLPNRLDNADYRLRSAEYVLPKIEVPALFSGGWDDYFLRGTIRGYLHVRSPRRLVVGPWGHGGVANEDETHRWLDYWLKGEGTNPTAGAKVRLFRTGSEDWIEREDWFDFKRATWREWKSLAAPAEVYAPPNLGGIAPPQNARTKFDPTSGFGHWPELFTADGAPFETVSDLDGQPGLEAWVEAGPCGDFEFPARLSVLKPDGSCVQLSEGRLLASRRALDLERSFTNAEGYPIAPWHTHDRVEKPEPAGFTRLNLELSPLCHRFSPGDRLRLGVTLIRADEVAEPAWARLGPQTRVLLPQTTGIGGA
ncbi:MAG: CocE/NonD family hydrolase [Planctomycetota bacterium]|nr:CocE/NonD family hydrolase [Planctomycetota bacterium]